MKTNRDFSKFALLFLGVFVGACSGGDVKRHGPIDGDWTLKAITCGSKVSASDPITSGSLTGSIQISNGTGTLTFADPATSCGIHVPLSFSYPKAGQTDVKFSTSTSTCTAQCSASNCGTLKSSVSSLHGSNSLNYTLIGNSLSFLNPIRTCKAQDKTSGNSGYLLSIPLEVSKKGWALLSRHSY